MQGTSALLQFPYPNVFFFLAESTGSEILFYFNKLFTFKKDEI